MYVLILPMQFILKHDHLSYQNDFCLCVKQKNYTLIPSITYPIKEIWLFAIFMFNDIWNFYHHYTNKPNAYFIMVEFALLSLKLLSFFITCLRL